MLRTALIGSKSIGVAALDVLRSVSELVGIVTLDDSADARSTLSTLREHGAAVCTTREAANAAIRALDADLVVVAGWYWIIPADIVNARPFIGIHHSLLPAYRGGSPLVWQLINGEREVGTSLFTLTDEMDAGPLWAQARVSVGDGYVGDVLRRCDAAAIELLPRLFDGTPPMAQTGAGASWCAQRSPGDGLIDWTKPAAEIVRWIRAQSRPYPGAFTYGAHRITIWRAREAEKRWYGTPGQVVGDHVMCGDGAIVVEESSERIHGRLSGTPV